MSQFAEEYINSIAKQVNEKSDDLFLQHAVRAVEKIVNERLKQPLHERDVKRKDDIKKDLESIVNNCCFEKRNELKEEIKEKINTFDYYPKISIYVEYGIRVPKARISRNINEVIIILPQQLKDNIKIGNNYNHKIIQQIRHMTAHELGHIILHMYPSGTVQLPQSQYKVKENFTKLQEEEAEIFAKELIKQRDERNKKFFESRIEQIGQL